MTQELLTTLANLKAELGAATANQNPNLTLLLSQASARANSETGRRFTPTAYVNEAYDGRGSSRLFLRQFPILSVSQLLVSGTSVPATTYPAATGAPAVAIQSGYVIGGDDADRLELYGYRASRGLANVLVSYTAGYQGTQAQAAASAVIVDQTSQTFLGDRGVTYASGAALTKVASAPAVGQYTLTMSGTDFGIATYGFNAADVGVAVVIAFATAPRDLELAVIQLVAYWLRQLQRGLDVQSKNVGGAVESYLTLALPPVVKDVFTSNRRVALTY